MRKELVPFVFAALVIIGYVVLHPYIVPTICYGVSLHGNYHWFPIPCGMWPIVR